MEDVLVILILLAIAGAAAWYLLRRKKRGGGCVGCSCSGQCGNACAACKTDKEQSDQKG